MKIIKSESIEIWFSPKRYVSFCDNKSIQFFIIKENNHILHRKNGPADSYNQILNYWINKGYVHRTDGYSYESNLIKAWRFKSGDYSEESYWNK